MNNGKYIEQLLKAFMQAQTTEKQESELADYFHSEKNIPAEWEAYKEYFKAFESERTSLTEEPAKPLGKRRWLYIAACVAAMIVFAVTLKYAFHTSENSKDIAIETSIRFQSSRLPKTKGTTVAEGKQTTTLVAKQRTPKKVLINRGRSYKSHEPVQEEYVPVPKPVVVTEAKSYVATSGEAMMEEPFHRINAANIEESVSYIKSRGEKLERQVMASGNNINYDIHFDKDLEQEL